MKLLLLMLLYMLRIHTCCEFGLYDAYDNTGTASSNGWKLLSLSDLSVGYFSQFISYMQNNNHQIQAIASWTPEWCGVKSAGDYNSFDINGNGYLDMMTDKCNTALVGGNMYSLIAYNQQITPIIWTLSTTITRKVQASGGPANKQAGIWRRNCITTNPTPAPTNMPTISPTIIPTFIPTTIPTFQPTFDPTVDPTKDPTSEPTTEPTIYPTYDPTNAPSLSPSLTPSMFTMSPSMAPTQYTRFPSFAPTFAERNVETFGQTQEVLNENNDGFATFLDSGMFRDEWVWWIIGGSSLLLCLCCFIVVGMVYKMKKMKKALNDKDALETDTLETEKKMYVQRNGEKSIVYDKEKVNLNKTIEMHAVNVVVDADELYINKEVEQTSKGQISDSEDSDEELFGNVTTKTSKNGAKTVKTKTSTGDV